MEEDDGESHTKENVRIKHKFNIQKSKRLLQINYSHFLCQVECTQHTSHTLILT